MPLIVNVRRKRNGGSCFLMTRMVSAAVIVISIVLVVGLVITNGRARATTSCSSGEIADERMASTSMSRICEQIGNRSPTFLWNSRYYNFHQEWHKKKQNSFWNAFDLRRGLVTRPPLSRGHRHRWGRILRKGVVRLRKQNEDTHSPITIVVITGGDINTNDHWTHQLKQTLSGIFSARRDIVDVLVRHVAPGTALDFATMVQSDNNTTETVDILVDATAISDMKWLRQQYDQHGYDDRILVSRPEASNDLRVHKQRWIRSVLSRSNCPAKISDPPLMVVLDDYLDSARSFKNHDNDQGFFPLTDTLYTRVLQRLTDWYQIPFLSIGTILRPYLHDDDRKHPTTRSISSSTADAIVSLLLYAALEWTVGYCQSISGGGSDMTIQDKESQVLVSRNAQELTDSTVILPPLDLSLTWQDVSRKWNQLQQEQANCPTKA